jgi:hypothetical protein
MIATRWRAGSGWTKPLSLTSRRVDAYGCDLAVSANGRGILSWPTGLLENGVTVRLMSRMGAWKRPVVLLGPDRWSEKGGAKVGMSRRGVPTVVYGNKGRLIAATRLASGTWKRVVTVPETASKFGSAFNLSIAGNGSAALLWVNYPDTGYPNLHVTLRTGGRWTTSRYLTHGFYTENESAVGTVVALASGQAVLTYPNDEAGEIRSRESYVSPGS